MKKTVVLYYSKKGSNRFIAEKLAGELNCDIEAIKPRFNVHLFLMLGLSFGIQKLNLRLTDFERVILCGPIWMGKFIVPLRKFVETHKNDINELVFVTCCGSGYEQKDQKFGHGLVFNVVKEMLGEKCSRCEALPITLVVPEDKKEDPNTVMNTRLSDANFNGEIAERFENLVKSLQSDG